MPITALVPWAVLLIFLGWAAFVDGKKKMLPLEPLWLIFGFALLWAFVIGHVVDALMGAAFWFAWTGGLWYLSAGRWMGFADLWLTAATGAWLGVTASLEAWYFTYVVIGPLVVILAFSGLIKKPQRIAFAPMLLGGVLLAFLSQGRLLAWFAQALQG
ncbi:MAG: hypothetical protein U0487_03295 [Patescibacteria group bacterium]